MNVRYLGAALLLSGCAEVGSTSIGQTSSALAPGDAQAFLDARAPGVRCAGDRVVGPAILRHSSVQGATALCSPSGQYVALYQNDGNFVVYDTTRPAPNDVWSTGTRSDGVPEAALTAACNFKVGGSWSTGTAFNVRRDQANFDRSGCMLVMQDDSNLVVYQTGDTGTFALWSSVHGKAVFPSHVQEVTCTYSGGTRPTFAMPKFYNLATGAVTYSAPPNDAWDLICSHLGIALLDTASASPGAAEGCDVANACAELTENRAVSYLVDLRIDRATASSILNKEVTENVTNDDCTKLMVRDYGLHPERFRGSVTRPSVATCSGPPTTTYADACPPPSVPGGPARLTPAIHFEPDLLTPLGNAQPWRHFLAQNRDGVYGSTGIVFCRYQSTCANAGVGVVNPNLVPPAGISTMFSGRPAGTDVVGQSLGAFFAYLQNAPVVYTAFGRKWEDFEHADKDFHWNKFVAEMTEECDAKWKRDSALPNPPYEPWGHGRCNAMAEDWLATNGARVYATSCEIPPPPRDDVAVTSTVDDATRTVF